jgi:signal transduction histidine kinase
MERRYRQSRVEDDLRNLRILVAVFVVAAIYFVRTDFILFGADPRFYRLLAIRGGYILAMVASLVVTRGNPRPSVLTASVAVVVILSILVMMIISLERPQNFSGNFAVEILFLLLVYVATPMPVLVTAAIGAIFTALWLTVLLTVRAGIDPVYQRMLIFLMGTANLGGLVVAYRSALSTRTGYYLFSREHAVRRELETLNASLDAFSHTVAHDLKNPTALTISATALMRELLSDETVDRPRMREILAMLEANARRQNRMISELLVLATIRRSAPVVRREIDVRRTLMQAIDHVSVLGEALGASITWTDPIPPACGHAAWVEEVWVNYLSNAVKYGGTPGRVECGAEERDEEIRYWVRDHGPGVPTEERARLFREFSRLDNPTVDGHGLGLSVAKRIVETLGGSVGIGDPAVGAEFWFTLPRSCQG